MLPGDGMVQINLYFSRHQGRTSFRWSRAVVIGIVGVLALVLHVSDLSVHEPDIRDVRDVVEAGPHFLAATCGLLTERTVQFTNDSEGMEHVRVPGDDGFTAEEL